MTGFIKKLFRSKSSAEQDSIEPTPKPAKPPAPPRNSAAYFLDADDAKTFGNIDYMRSSKSVRRTFSKKKIGEDNESIRVISSLQVAKGQNSLSPVINPLPSQDSTNQTNGSGNKTSERRSADSSMDMFRNMAREIRKG
ncbi:MAG: hypothetical protein HC827_11020 [Cyanobacteria bacterium RM1_2_2]|nr:hypothetical protein [Cyanobacteria bacterium RM1_2_2]